MILTSKQAVHHLHSSPTPRNWLSSWFSTRSATLWKMSSTKPIITTIHGPSVIYPYLATTSSNRDLKWMSSFSTIWLRYRLRSGMSDRTKGHVCAASYIGCSTITLSSHVTSSCFAVLKSPTCSVRASCLGFSRWGSVIKIWEKWGPWYNCTLWVKEWDVFSMCFKYADAVESYMYIYIYISPNMYIYMSALHQCCIYVNYDLMSAHDYCDFTVTFRTQGLRNSSPHYSFNVLGIWVFLNVAI